MNKFNAILVLGILVVLLPFLGFPQAYDNFLFVVLGASVFILTYLLKGELDSKENVQTNREENSEENLSA